MNVKWYYRQSEVPDSVYQHLVQDRNNENGETVLCLQYTHIHRKVNTLTCSVTLNFPPSQTHTHLPQFSSLLWDVRASCELHFKENPEDSGGQANPVALCLSLGNAPLDQTAALSSVNNPHCHVALEHTHTHHTLNT